MKFKKVAALVLASAMTLGLAACGNGNSSTPSQSSGGASSSGTTSSSATEISLWSFNIGGFTEASNWDSLIAAFNEANPDIKVTVTPINYQDGDQKLTSAITSGSGPDIIFEGPERIVGNYAVRADGGPWATCGAMPPRILARIFPVSASWTGPTTCTP